MTWETKAHTRFPETTKETAMTTERYEAGRCPSSRPIPGLTAHLRAFLTVNAVLFAPTGFNPKAGHFWGWGLGVAAHALAVFGPGSRIRRHLVQRQLRRTSEQPQ